MTQVKYSPNVLFELEELFVVLIDKGYFSYYEQANDYVSGLINYIDNNISSLPKYRAPDNFKVYGASLHYIFYRRSQHTTWYIMFEIIGDTYYIKHITNNHVVGHFFNND